MRIGVDHNRGHPLCPRLIPHSTKQDPGVHKLKDVHRSHTHPRSRNVPVWQKEQLLVVNLLIPSRFDLQTAFQPLHKVNGALVRFNVKHARVHRELFGTRVVGSPPHEGLDVPIDVSVCVRLVEAVRHAFQVMVLIQVQEGVLNHHDVHVR